MIPKIIWAIWLNDTDPLPDLMQQCIESQRSLAGYEHRLVTLANVYTDAEYVQQALEKKCWVKAADFLRMHYLYTHGGIYLDADMEILRDKNFDDLLHHRLFCSWELNGFIANSAVGAEPQHPVIGEYLSRLLRNYKGSGDMIFEPGMRLWSDVVYWAEKREEFGIKLLPAEYFLPYDHEKNTVRITENTRTFHHFMRLWTDDLAK